MVQKLSPKLLLKVVAALAVIASLFVANSATALKREETNNNYYLVPTGNYVNIAENLYAPWELLFLPDGQALVDERDTGTILQIGTDFKITKVAFTRTTPPCVKFCEGGTLGMAYAADRENGGLSLFVYPVSYTHLTLPTTSRV